MAKPIVVGAYEAKTKLAELLDAVEGGVEITITRRGLPVARLIPVTRAPKSTAAMERWLAIRETVQPLGMTMKEAIEQGRRH